MDKEKEIAEMMKITRGYKDTVCITPYDEAVFQDMMTALYEANYRRADEVEQETAKFIVDALTAYDEEGNIREIIDLIAQKYGVEVDE